MAEYNGIAAKDADTLYFIKGTRLFFRGNEPYGDAIVRVEALPAVKDALPELFYFVVSGSTAGIYALDAGKTKFVNVTVKGDTGPAATVKIGTVATGAAGSSASVTNSGTQYDAVLNFTIPRGATGATGATGAPGTPGAAGADGSDANTFESLSEIPGNKLAVTLTSTVITEEIRNSSSNLLIAKRVTTFTSSTVFKVVTTYYKSNGSTVDRTVTANGTVSSSAVNVNIV